MVDGSITKTVCVVGTQAQYLNVVEAASAFGFPFETAALIAPRAMRDKEGEPEEPWMRTRWYSLGSDIGWLSRLLGRTPLGRASRTVDHVKMYRGLLPPDAHGCRLVVGSLFDRRVRHLANTLEPSELVVVDDGTATLDVARTLRSRPEPPRLAALGERALGIRSGYPIEGTLFTVYDVDLPSGWHRRANRYSVLRAQLDEAVPTDETLVVGGPYVDFGWIDRAGYLAHLRRIGAGAGWQVSYVPHRAESDAEVRAIADATGWAVWRPPQALEAALVAARRVPREVVGFYSSFLPNAAVLFGEACRVRAVEAVFPSCPPRLADVVRDVYGHFRAHVDAPNFSVVTTDEVERQPAAS